MRIGTTFSHRQAAYIGLHPKQSLVHTLDLNFDLIRLCSYWNELQPTKNRVIFDGIFSYLDLCEQKNQPVIMTVGMKAPRWPEFYIPEWAETTDIQEYLLEYLNTLINRLKTYSCIKYWQIENEPFDPSGPQNKTISPDLLTKEIDLVSHLDPTRPIIVTAWGNQLRKRNFIPTLTNLADIVGLDMYYKVPHQKLFKKTYTGPSDPLSTIKKCVTDCKEYWIMELQAEPWENFNIYTSDLPTPSFTPQDLQKNFEETQKLDSQTILFWGVEYWLWQAKKGNMRLIEEYKKLRNEL